MNRDRSNSPGTSPPAPASRWRRNGRLSGLIFAVLAVAYIGYWFIIAANLRSGLIDWINDAAGAGITASYERIEIVGFPTSFRIIVSAPTLTGSRFSSARDGDRWQWRGHRVVAEMRPWNFDHLTVDLSGRHRISVNNAAWQVEFDGAVGQLIVAARRDADGWPQRLDVKIRDLKLHDPGQNMTAAVTHGEIAAERYFADPWTPKSPSFGLQLDLTGLRLPKLPRRYVLPLGHEVAKLVADLRVMGRAPDPRSPGALAAWRDDGGIVELVKVETRYGPLFMRANGTAALDENLQPIAALTAHVEGFFKTVDQLRAARAIRSGDAILAKIVLGALAKRPGGGGPASISLPLTVQNGELHAGPLKLMDVPPIDWAFKLVPREGIL